MAHDRYVWMMFSFAGHGMHIYIACLEYIVERGGIEEARRCTRGKLAFLIVSICLPCCDWCQGDVSWWNSRFAGFDRNTKCTFRRILWVARRHRFWPKAWTEEFVQLYARSLRGQAALERESSVCDCSLPVARAFPASWVCSVLWMVAAWCRPMQAYEHPMAPYLLRKAFSGDIGVLNKFFQPFDDLLRIFLLYPIKPISFESPFRKARSFLTKYWVPLEWCESERQMFTNFQGRSIPNTALRSQVGFLLHVLLWSFVVLLLWSLGYGLYSLCLCLYTLCR